MHRQILLSVVTTLVLVWVGANMVVAFQRTARRPQAVGTSKGGKGARVRPSDPRLVDLHREFLSKTEKLAAEYERKRDWDRAREVYEAILRLVPTYPQAEAGLGRVVCALATQDRKIVEFFANQGWQITGIVLSQGKPVKIVASGAWEVVNRTGPDGLEIPKKMKQFKIGALVGMIVAGDVKDAKPFLIGSKKEFIAPATGRLLLVISDVDPSDNRGKMAVQIESTFAK